MAQKSMKKVMLIIKSLMLFPFKMFTRVSPFTVIQDSKIGKKSAILSFTRFHSSSIDDYSYIGRNCLLLFTNIGKYCSIADNCSIGMASHSIDWVSTSSIFNKSKNILGINFANKNFSPFNTTSIENDVWIGINVIVLAGLKIGTGAVIGAGSVVTKNVEPYAIVAGNPAKTIRYRFDDETINKLLATKWWLLDENTIRLKAKYADDVQKFLEDF